MLNTASGIRPDKMKYPEICWHFQDLIKKSLQCFLKVWCELLTTHTWEAFIKTGNSKKCQQKMSHLSVNILPQSIIFRETKVFFEAIKSCSSPASAHPLQYKRDRACSPTGDFLMSVGRVQGGSRVRWGLDSGELWGQDTGVWRQGGPG